MSYPSEQHRLLLVTFNFRSAPQNVDDWTPRFDYATDWYRYAPNCWLLWTSGTPETWYDFLKPFINDQDYMVIVDVPLSGMIGWLPQGAWQWLGKYTALKNSP